MVWPIVLAAVSAVAGVFNALDEHTANRKIKDDLEEIKKYLQEIQSGIDFIKSQNTAILQRLDDLPAEVRRIVSEVVSAVVLSGRYSEIDNVKDNYLSLLNKSGKSKGYGIRDAEWITYSAAMTYIFQHEGRISSTFDLIKICEIALIITKERALDFVVLRLDQRIKAMDDLQFDLNVHIEARIQKSLIDLNNSIYIQNHNLNENLNSIDNLDFTMQPDRTITEGYMVRECHTKYSRYSDGYEVCENVLKYHQVPDSAFHIARNNFAAMIRTEIDQIKQLLVDLGALSAAKAKLQKYSDGISSGMALADMHRVMYFASTNKMSEFSLETRASNPVDQDDFDEYFDSCRGVCDAAEEVAEGDNISFFKIPC